MAEAPTKRVTESYPLGAACALASTLVTLLKAAITPLWDADLWWILRAGQLCLAERAVPVTNRFSFTAPSHPWVMHEWLFGVGYALAHSRGAMAGIALARLSMVTALCAVLLVCCARDAPAGLAGALFALALTVYGGGLESPRPACMSALFAVCAVALTFDPRFARRHALGFAALMLVWTNAHGSFPLGLVVAFASLFESPFGENSSPRRERALGLALGALATFANPYGARMHRLVGRYLTGRDTDSVSLVHARILEWWPLLRAPLRVASIPELLGGLALGVFFCALLGDPRWRARALLGLGLLAMALSHNRHLALAGLLGAMLSAAPLAQRLKTSEIRLRGRYALRWMLPAMILSVSAWAMGQRGRSEGDWADASGVDESFARLLGGLPEGARVYVPLAFTGWAVLKGYPRARVFFDTRNDCYPYPVLALGFDVNDARLSPEAAHRGLLAFGTQYAVLACDSPTAKAFRDFRLAARDGRVCRYDAP